MENIDFSKIYSYSKINSFENCPKQYHFSYLDPDISPRKKEFYKPRDYKTKGSAVHGAITLFYHLPLKKRIFDNLKKCLASAWYSEIDMLKSPPLGEIGGFRDLSHERAIYYDALRMLKNFYRISGINPDFHYIPAENIRDSFEEYKIMIKPISDNVSISGKFDRIDKIANGNLRIIDYKTSKEENGLSQLEFYKLLAELNYNEKVEIVSYYYLDTGKIKDFNAKNFENGLIKEKLLEKIYNIENDRSFGPRKSGLCNHCDFKEICPLFAN